ncbi:hypothetical protein SAMN05216241_104169 [Limimonas halophila]|uniref:DUF2155 domain-containing protein n=1 Tax=Limimonas halophila TaxID=1082479 RepID=A0A1G7QW07_9PROT|nr:DUF2155 domain-containing protein [Limimonas halophila]SDG02716.1 hypothetical protein SAMN05216241_104169 [Limimonas halophila]
MIRPARAVAGIAAALLVAAAAPAAAIEADVVVLKGLDKITARTSTFKVPVGGTRTFGTLKITARHCWKTPPEKPPQRKAFLEIVDNRPDQPAEEVFSGWMFSTKPALSALEHPVYDVWVIDCTVTDGSNGAAPEKGSAG